MPLNGDQSLPVVRVGEIKIQDNAQRWLVEELWAQARLV